jgi:toxin YoeB
VRLIFSSQAWSDYLFWEETDAATLARLNELIKQAMRTPFSGIGKPEPLARELKGFWSRRINQEHRLVYRVCGSGDQQSLEIASCRFHYDR